MEYGEDSAIGLHDSGKCLAVRRFLAWCVHAYTALGLVLAAAMTVLIVQGGARAFRSLFLLMLIATLIDATDGTLARAARVKELLPRFDGGILDYLVDFLNYVALPVFLLWRAEVLPAGREPYLLAPLLAGAYWFCQVDAKTEDGYFLGFPALWNVVAFYLYVLHFHVVPIPSWLLIGILVSLSLLTVVPSRYLYSTRSGKLNLLTNVLAAVWIAMLCWILLRLPTDGSPTVAGRSPEIVTAILISLLFPAYYLAGSWIISWRWMRAGRTKDARPPAYHALSQPKAGTQR